MRPAAGFVLVLALLGAAQAEAQDVRSFLADDGAAAPGPEVYGDWMMWWSTNREDFLSSNGTAAASRPADAQSVQPVTDEIFRSEIAPVLLAALNDRERQVREAAAIALGMSGDSRDVEALAALLGDRDRAAVEAAILGLGMLRAPKAEEALAKVLRDEAAMERRHAIAALALGLSGGEAAQKPLFDGLGTGKSDKIESCRMVGAALWSGGDGPEAQADRCALVANQIHKGLVNQESKRRKLLSMGIAALAKTRDPGSAAFVLEMLQDTRFDVRAAAAIAAGRVLRAADKAHVQALIKALAGEAHTLPIRFMIISLGRIGGADAIAALSQQLASGDKYRRAFAALALGIAGATSAADTLREGLTGGNDNRVKGAFAIALGLMKDPKAFAAIAKIAQGKPDDELLEHCAWYFALSQSLEARAPLEKILGESRAAPAQEAAAIALGVLGMVESQQFLERHLFAKGTDASRGAAATALGRMRDRRGIAPLIKVVKAHEPPLLRAAAISALGLIARHLDRPPFARVAIDAYYGIQNEAIDDVATLAGSLMKTTEEGGAQGGK